MRWMRGFALMLLAIAAPAAPSLAAETNMLTGVPDAPVLLFAPRDPATRACGIREDNLLPASVPKLLRAGGFPVPQPNAEGRGIATVGRYLIVTDQTSSDGKACFGRISFTRPVRGCCEIAALDGDGKFRLRRAPSRVPLVAFAAAPGVLRADSSRLKPSPCSAG